MKIGIVCPYNIFKPGGVQEHVQYQAAELRKRGHEVTIITPRPRGHEDEPTPEGVVFVGGSARIKTPSATSGDVSVTIDVDAVDAELAKGYDVIHVHEPAIPLLARQLLPRVSCLRLAPIMQHFQVTRWADRSFARIEHISNQLCPTLTLLRL
jgi:phosphatidylinositol alpha-mannosyltransferase